MKLEAYFLPYQVRWLQDPSPVKLWEKSRRIGATYVQAYEDVRDCAAGKVPAVWFSSADESAAREYIEYAERWTRLFHLAAKPLGQVVLDSEQQIRTFQIAFANGSKIHALSSNPKALRSKGGKVVLDEFAHHEDAAKMWAAARPVVTWGYPLRILSTHNGAASRFNRFLEAAQKGRLPWSIHTTTLEQAVAEGLVDKILGRPTTEAERQAWIREQRADCFDEQTWLQEYCCLPMDEATAFLPYDLLAACELEECLTGPEAIAGDLYVGMDIGRKQDLTVLAGVERLGRVRYLRILQILERAPFHVQRDALFALLAHPKLRRACLDATGLGMQLAEEAQRQCGRYRVEAITFTSKVKEELAYTLRMHCEDRTVAIPPDPVLREDLHAVRKITTAAGNLRFDAARSEQGHSDRFWSLALALHAAQDQAAGPVTVASKRKRAAPALVAAYY